MKTTETIEQQENRNKIKEELTHVFHIFKRFWWFEHLAWTKSVLCASTAQYCFSNRAQWNRVWCYFFSVFLCIVLCGDVPLLFLFTIGQFFVVVVDWKSMWVCMCVCVFVSVTLAHRISMHEILISVSCVHLWCCCLVLFLSRSQNRLYIITIIIK